MEREKEPRSCQGRLEGKKALKQRRDQLGTAAEEIALCEPARETIDGRSRSAETYGDRCQIGDRSLAPRSGSVETDRSPEI